MAHINRYFNSGINGFNGPFSGCVHQVCFVTEEALNAALDALRQCGHAHNYCVETLSMSTMGPVLHCSENAINCIGMEL